MSVGRSPEPSWRELIVATLRMLDDASRSAGQFVGETLQAAETWIEAARPTLTAIGRAALTFRDAYDEGVPSGWQALEADQMLDVIALMAETGWCLTTSPPPETLLALLAVDDAGARERILLAVEPRILDDLDLELRAIDRDGLPLFIAAAREAWDAHASGLFMASQALSATVVAALSHGRGPLGLKSLGAARSQLERLNIEEASLRELRFYAVGRAVATALRNFHPDGPEPRLFNRHASTHSLSAEQYSQFNSLTALMLACGWLREVLWLMRAASEIDNDEEPGKT